MTETQPAPLTTADVKRRYSWGMAPHKSIPGGMYTVASAAADFDRWLTAHDAEVRADERAKRPDREQGPDVLSAEERTEIWSALRYQATTVDDMIRAQLRLGRGLDDPQQVADAARRDGLIELAGRVRDSSSLALEPEAREEKPPVYLASDLWSALQLLDAEFDGYYERNGWADTWSNLLAEVRLRSGARSCGEDADGEPCVLMTESHLVHYGASDVGSSEPLPSPEAREVTDAEVEAAARVLFAREEPDMNDWRWSRPNPHTPDAPFEWHNYWRGAARVALEAAREVSRG